MSGPRIVIIGSGVVGAALADELSMRGATEVTVVDKGPLFVTGGSSSHAPGLISRTSASKFIQETADYTIEKFAGLATEEGPALIPVGTLEVAYNAERLRELWRRHNVARSWGWRGRMLDPDEALQRWPILQRDGLLGAYATDGEGLAVSRRAVQAQAGRAQAAGASFVGNTEVTGFDTSGGSVTGVVADGGTIAADVVVVCAGVWGPRLANMVGLTLPMLAMEHQYAITTPIEELAANAEAWATMPILRHHDGDIYYRDHGDRVGIGSFHHDRLPVSPDEIDTHPRNHERSLAYAFTEEHWSDAWKVSVDLLPALEGAGLTERFNGVFGFTPDGYPLIGEHPGLRGMWFAESVWVTHSAGVARVVAERILEGGASIDDSPADLSRFDERELDPAVFEARCDDAYRDVYVAHHPVEPHTSARGLRWSPFVDAQRELGPVLFDVATWERPQWFEANAGLVDEGRFPARDAWSSAHWSPIAIAEHLAVRERGGLFDMTPLYRIEVAGPGAESFLLRMVAGRCDGPVGSVRYSVMLDDRGGIRSDVTVSRFAEERFVVGANGPRDLAWLRAHEPADGVSIEPVSDGRACLAVWGPLARDVLAPIADIDLSNDAFPYMSARSGRVGDVSVEAVRISYAGELGWEFTCDIDEGRALWEAVWPRASDLGLIAAGRAALGSLRIEKGYRAWGVDMTPEHAPGDAGLGFTVRSDGSDFLGRDGLAARPAAPRRLRCLVLEGTQPAMGGEPVLSGDDVVGYVTSSAWGPSVGESIAFAWMDRGLDTGASVDVAYLERNIGARIAPEPRFDPEGERLRD
jgi:glycine cleavage system aminomethyltransferase T/glycine/D-amino acid oxidase-like deaminating enzyme